MNQGVMHYEHPYILVVRQRTRRQLLDAIPDFVVQFPSVVLLGWAARDPQPELQEHVSGLC